MNSEQWVVDSALRRPAVSRGIVGSKTVRQSANIVLLLAMVVFAASMALAVPSATALFRSARTIANNAFHTAPVGAPSTLRARRRRQNIRLTWQAGTNGDGYQILRATNTAPTCAGVTWQVLAHVTGIGTTFYIDRNAPQQAGKWYCYQVRTTFSTWTSQTNNPTTAIQ